MSHGAILLLMTGLFLLFGYMGVPVSFALIAGVLTATAFTQISMQSMVGQLFHGIDSEALLAVPFFLLVGELMASSDVAHRMIRLSQTLVGHLRGGLAQVVTLFSMFFAGISGSSTADVAVLSRTIARDMDREGYDRAFTAALIASASTMANLIPPSIMAVVYGATGNVSIGGLFLAGIVPGVLIGIGLMIYSYFWGPVGVKKLRAPLAEVAMAARGSALPLVIPVIIMGGILSGFFTPTEAGMVAAVYIIVVLIPVLRPSHVKELPRDFVYTGLLYSLPLALVAGASAFGWMLAYLRGPDIVAGWIEAFAGHNGRIIMILLVLLFIVIGDFMYAGLLYSLPLAAVAGASAFGWMVAYLRGPDIVAAHISAFAGTDGAKIMFLLVALFVIVGDFIDAVPAIIIFMPIIIKLTQVGDINPLHMGVVIITTLVFGLITPPYGLSLLVASKYVGVGFGKAVVRSLPLYVVFFATIAFTVLFPDIVLWLPKMFLPESVGCFKSPTGAGYICP